MIRKFLTWLFTKLFLLAEYMMDIMWTAMTRADVINKVGVKNLDEYDKKRKMEGRKKNDSKDE